MRGSCILDPCLCADTTAGGSTDEEPIWYTNQDVLVQSLETVYAALFLKELLFFERSLHDEDEESVIPSVCLDLQRFTLGDKPSMFVYLLQHHDASIVYVLKWAIGKMISMLESEYSLHTRADLVRKET